jgi:hypothetical protein
MTTLQQPIGSGFGITSTADDLIRGIDLEGKIAIVTGAYSGLGRETARVLLSAGARVIVPARDVHLIVVLPLCLVLLISGSSPSQCQRYRQLQLLFYFRVS